MVAPPLVTVRGASEGSTFSKMCIGIAVSDQQYGITTVDESANENFDSARDRMRAEQLCVMEEAQILLDNQNGVSYPAYLRN